MTVHDPALAARNRQAFEAAKRRNARTDWQRVRDIAEAQAAIVEPVRLGRDVEAAEWRDPEDTNPNRREPRRVKGHRRMDVLYHLYHGRHMLTRRQAAAGVRLRDDYEVSQGAKPGAERSEVRGGGTLGPAEAQLAAVARYRAAMQAMGPQLSGVVLHVVLHNGTLQEWREVQRAVATDKPGKVYVAAQRARAQLIEGLDRLEAHYGGGLALADEMRVEE